jgi:hypothetical protein
MFCPVLDGVSCGLFETWKLVEGEGRTTNVLEGESVLTTQALAWQIPLQRKGFETGQGHTLEVGIQLPSVQSW